MHRHFQKTHRQQSPEFPAELLAAKNSVLYTYAALPALSHASLYERLCNTFYRCTDPTSEAPGESACRS